MGSVGAPWVVDGIAANSPSGAPGASGNQLGSTAQLVQAMASFGAGAADTSTTVPLAAETSQQTFLAPPHT
jgi:hypothetical protein